MILSALSNIRNRRHIAHFLKYVRTKPKQTNKKICPYLLTPYILRPKEEVEETSQKVKYWYYVARERRWKEGRGRREEGV